MAQAVFCSNGKQLGIPVGRSGGCGSSDLPAHPALTVRVVLIWVTRFLTRLSSGWVTRLLTRLSTAAATSLPHHNPQVVTSEFRPTGCHQREDAPAAGGELPLATGSRGIAFYDWRQVRSLTAFNPEPLQQGNRLLRLAAGEVAHCLQS